MTLQQHDSKRVPTAKGNHYISGQFQRTPRTLFFAQHRELLQRFVKPFSARPDAESQYKKLRVRSLQRWTLLQSREVHEVATKTDVARTEQAR